MRLHLFVSGRVQGVFFRAYVLESAKSSSIFGWVKNLEDGRVEIVAEGNPKDLVKFMALVKLGSKDSDVSEIEVQEEEDISEFTCFERR